MPARGGRPEPPPHDARAGPPPRAGIAQLFVVVDSTVGLDETEDAPLVELIQRVEPGPRGERDLVFHPGIRREDDVAVVLVHDGFELRDEIRAFAVVLHDGDDGPLAPRRSSGCPCASFALGHVAPLAEAYGSRTHRPFV